MNAPVWLWALRVVAAIPLIGLLMYFGRALRHVRAAQFRPRPSSAQGLAGRYTPAVTLLVPARNGRVDPSVAGLRYPGLSVVVAVPAGIRVLGAPPRARVVEVAADSTGALLAAASEVADGEILAVLPPGCAVGPGFLQRLVAPLVDPFIGATVGRLSPAVPGRTLAGYVRTVDLLVRATLQSGRNAIGAPVFADGEPFAIRAALVHDLRGWDVDHPSPDTELLVRVYVRGFLVAYVEQAVALAPTAGWWMQSHDLRRRVAGRRRAWRKLRRPLYKRKVLEGPEKTDVRWETRGASAPLWLASGWLLAGALRLADTSWAPEAIAGVLALLTFATAVWLAPLAAVTGAATVARRRRELAFVPWLPLFGAGAMWSGSGAALLSPFGWRRKDAGARPEILAEQVMEAVPEPEPEIEPEVAPPPETPRRGARRRKPPPAPAAPPPPVLPAEPEEEPEEEPEFFETTEEVPAPEEVPVPEEVPAPLEAEQPVEAEFELFRHAEEARPEPVELAWPDEDERREEPEFLEPERPQEVEEELQELSWPEEPEEVREPEPLEEPELLEEPEEPATPAVEGPPPSRAEPKRRRGRSPPPRPPIWESR